MPPAVAIALLVTLASLLIMLGEAILSSFNERQLRAKGAVEPEGDVINMMRLVVPGEPLVSTGPYQFMSHPNYLAVVGEMVSVAMIVWAPITGILSLLVFGW